jgi:hypothetical protein
MRAAGKPDAMIHRFYTLLHSDAVEGAGNVMPLLGVTGLVGIEWDGYQQLATAGIEPATLRL